jgi:hypothetical protein
MLGRIALTAGLLAGFAFVLSVLASILGGVLGL